MYKIPTSKWEFAVEAAETAEGLREHFVKHGFAPAIILDKAHWQLIILALEKAAQ